jgi:SP family general alpha glucoside:H+ symporter-like MFS transporter
MESRGYISPQNYEAQANMSGNICNDLSSTNTATMEKSDAIEKSTQAKDAAKVERDMTIWQSIIVFRWGVICAVLLALACVMEGYSLVLVTSFFEVDQFRHDYNKSCTLGQDQTCELPASWQIMLVDIPMLGQMIGITLNGWATDRYGYRWTFIVAVIAAGLFNFLNFFSSGSLLLFLLGQTFTGIPYGVFQVLAATYASDVVPNRIRGIFSSMVNLDWIIGQVMASVVMAGLHENTSSAAYKVPLALTWIFPIPIIIAALLAPESPWWLIRKKRIPEARKAIEKTTSGRAKNTDYDIDKHLILMQQTNEEEMKHGGSGKDGASMTYLDCFKGGNLRRTEIACCVWGAQNLVGPALMNYSTYFLTKSGVDKDMAFKISIGQVRPKNYALDIPY